MERIKISEELREKFPELNALIFRLNGVNVKQEIPELEKFKEKITEEVRKDYTLEKLKDDSIFRAYRDFFWKIKIDPTKVRPAAEALMRRILSEKELPKINSLVDAYNLASIKTKIALAVFDSDKLKGNLEMRFSEKKEKFLGIGMNKEIELEGNEIVLSDSKKLIAIYPYRDSDESKISLGTKNIFLISCGVPGIKEEELENAGKISLNYIKKFCSF